MPPKGKKAGGGEKQKGDEQREDPLQAVIFADSFETRFTPFTLEKPRCLLRLANVPLIEYTLGFLANGNVEEVFIYGGAHVEQVEEYIQQSKWASSSSPFSRVELIRSVSRSIGDAMRDLDKRGVLAGDFIVVYGDVVSNLSLDRPLAAHRARRQTDKNAIMTMVLREAGTTHRTKEQGAKPVFVIDPAKKRCLHFEQMREGKSSEGGHHISIAPELLSEHREIEVRQDLIDCGVDIYTPEALSLWSENFDYEAPRKGFLHGVLKDYELNEKTIHTYIVSDHYAARVRNIHAYDAISRDVISRWAYPLCPDSDLLRGHSYQLRKGNIYLDSGVMLSRTCDIRTRTVIGADSYIGDHTVISDSVIGARCRIGKNVRIEGAYIWDDVTIDDGSVVTTAILADAVRVGKSCVIEPGALLSYNVVIADSTTVPGPCKITKKSSKGAGFFDNDTKLVGDGGLGFGYEDSDEDDEVAEGRSGTELLYKNPEATVTTESISTLRSDSEFDSDDEGGPPRRHHDRSAGGSFISLESEDGIIGGNSSGDSQKKGRVAAADFHHEAVASILDSLQKGDDTANINLELNSLRMGVNASPHQVRRALVSAFMRRISQAHDAGDSVKVAVEKSVRPHADMFRRNFSDLDSTQKADQVDFLALSQADLAHRRDGPAIMLFVANELYTTDVLQAEAFEQWWGSERSKADGDDGARKVREGMAQFMDVLMEESEDDEDEDDEEDDSDE